MLYLLGTGSLKDICFANVYKAFNRQSELSLIGLRAQNETNSASWSCVQHITFALQCLTGCVARTREQFPVCVYISEMPRLCLWRWHSYKWAWFTVLIILILDIRKNTRTYNNYKITLLIDFVKMFSGLANLNSELELLGVHPLQKSICFNILLKVQCVIFHMDLLAWSPSML